MSNSSLVNYTKISPNSSKPRGAAIKKITIHHMAGNLTVESCGAVFATSSRQASSNYAIGTDGRVGMYVEEKNRAWTSSSTANDNQAVTIEVANDELGGNWHVGDTALAKLLDLCEDICRRNGITELNYTGDSSGNLTRHNMFAATSCPGPYLQGRFSYIAAEVNKRLGVASEDANGCPYGTSTATVKSGSTGAAVKRCQWYLKELGYDVGEIDGDCGAKTVAGIKSFQAFAGLDADGICGTMTWAALDAAYAKRKAGSGTDGSENKTAEKTPAEITVDNAIADGVLADRAHWVSVLSGKTTAVPEYLKTVFDRYHEKVR